MSQWATISCYIRYTLPGIPEHSIAINLISKLTLVLNLNMNIAQ